MTQWGGLQGSEGLGMGSNPSIYVYSLLHYYDFELSWIVSFVLSSKLKILPNF